jgi:hypothetical protein
MRSLATIQLRIAIGIAAIASVAGCTTSRATDVGTLEIPLIEPEHGSTQYRLSAQFAISGPSGPLTVDGSGDARALTLALQPGDYTVTVLDGWQLERSANGAPFEPVAAQLGSANPVHVTITSGQSETVSFTFLVEVPNHGSLTIVLGISRLHARLVGTLHAMQATGDFVGYLDYPATFTLAYALTTDGVVNVPPRFHESESEVNELAFTDDPLGILATGPVSGGFLAYKIEVEADTSQVLQLTYDAPADAPPVALSASASPLTPKLPVDDLGIPTEPGSIGLRTTTAFTLARGAADTMSGTIDLDFEPAE